MPKFNERLKLLRQESGLSQFDFAKQIGLSKSSVNMYERGEREPSIETLESIADYFNVDMDFLLGKSEHRNKNQWLIAFRHSQELSLPLETMTAQEEIALSTASSKEGVLNKELISRIAQLTPAELEKVDAFVQGLLAAR